MKFSICKSKQYNIQQTVAAKDRINMDIVKHISLLVNIFLVQMSPFSNVIWRFCRKKP